MIILERLKNLMRNLLLTISYKGTNYHGFQVQKNAVTISEVLQFSIESILGHKIELKGCSRTDAGVHAYVYCISFKTNSNILCNNLVKAINMKLPCDIVAIECVEVDNDFHARYDCKSKEYIYKIWNEEYPNPFLFETTYHYKYYLNETMLNREIKDFIGTHDFRAFCNYKKSRDMNDTIRSIYDCSVQRDNGLVSFKVCGNGFLYNMVRIMVGTLIFISEGKVKKGAIPYIIEKRDRMLAGKTMPPVGLYLNNVYY